MDEKKTVYAIVYMKNDLVEEKYISEYVPYNIVEGTDDLGFIDKDGNGYSNLDDENVVLGIPQFCVGKRYSLEELKSKYGDLPKRKLLENFFKDEKSKRIFGEEVDGEFTITEDNDYEYGIDLNNDNYDEDELYTDNDEDFDEDDYEKYIYLKKEVFNGEDFVILNTNDLYIILEFDNKREIFNFIKTKTRDISSYFEDEDKYAVFSHQMISTMFNMLDINSIKNEIRSRFDKIDLSLSTDELARQKMAEELEEQAELNEVTKEEIIEKEADENFQLVIEIMKEVIEKFDEVFETVRKIQEPINEDKIEFIKGIIISLEQCVKRLVDDLVKEVNDDKRVKPFLEFFEIVLQGLDELENINDETIQDEFVAFHNQFIENYNRMLEDILKKYSIKPIDEDIKPEDLIKAIDECIKEFDSLIGMKEIKENIKKLLDTVLFRQKVKDYINLDSINKHLVFLGNPGTGKTTVAVMLSKILYKLGYLESSKVAEVTAKDLVGEYVGHTAVKTSKVIKANKKGLIIIDEAYILANGSNNGNDFGKEAIAEILKEMEKNETMFIFCGYKKEMVEFLRLNSGLKSRIGNNYEFKDYNVEELYEMFLKKLESSQKPGSPLKLKIDEDLEDVIKLIISEAVKEKDFGNGRFIDNLYSQILATHANNTRNEYDIEKLLTLTIEDIDENIMKKMFYKGNKTSIGFNGSGETKDEVKVYLKAKKESNK